MNKKDQERSDNGEVNQKKEPSFDITPDEIELWSLLREVLDLLEANTDTLKSWTPGCEEQQAKLCMFQLSLPC